jgi:hypothetical protein
LGKITEIEVSKGKTVQVSDKEWLKIEYGIKAQIDSEEEVSVAKSHIEGLLDGWLTPIEVVKPTQEKLSTPKKTLETISKSFPQDLRDLLTFTENSEAFIIRPRQFLGSENFAKIVTIVKDQLGGQYVSRGKESHFLILK